MLALAGCQFSQPTSIGDRAGSLASNAAKSHETLSVLSVTGGLCLVAGMVLLVVTGGRKGWYPVIGGIILVVLNYAVARYGDYLFYPLVACTALISAAWTYKIIKQILLEKKTK
jgi:hypothetical protein